MQVRQSQCVDAVGCTSDPPAHVGPTQYSQMVWAILFGYVLFRVGAVKIGSLTAGSAAA
jgi:hypothetical protein